MAAAGILDMDGIGGELVIKIPSKCKDFPELQFYTGSYWAAIQNGAR